MNKLYGSLILMLLCLSVSLPLLAAETDEEAKELGFWVELQTVSSRLPAKAIVWYERELTENFGLYAFVWKEADGYQEYIVGPTWKPVEELQLGCGIGRESTREEGRGARWSCFADATIGKLNLSGAAENGRISGPWKKITVTYAVTNLLEPGFIYETGFGNGLILKLNEQK
ncbi:MAG: hypothetical protein NUV90_00160, partial [Candidatus Parcubacteria bacterium]|nr:hypothetical protein [Candidatus Parcubacteria bacterium]